MATLTLTLTLHNYGIRNGLVAQQPTDAYKPSDEPSPRFHRKGSPFRKSGNKALLARYGRKLALSAHLSPRSVYHSDPASVPV